MSGFKTVCVIGLGYIGLPTAAIIAQSGITVTGVDVSQRVVDALARGEVHVDEAGLADLVASGLASGRLFVQMTPAPADAFIIAVPTPFGRAAEPSDGGIASDPKADLSYVRAAAQSIAPFLRPGNLVILESTSPPRTTVDVVRPILESQSGLMAGRDFLLAYSPERVLPGGQLLREMKENARVIGGFDRASAEAGSELYRRFVTGDITLTDATTAEVVKLMENTFRDVNIALANEFALMAEHTGIDVWEAIALANKHPRVKILRPGPGVGGHCIAVDPWFLVEAAPDVTPLIRTARQVNDSMPARVVARVERAIGAPAPWLVVCVLGLAYKANVGDARESPSLEIVRRLVQRGYTVRAHDPLVDAAGLHDGDLACPLLPLDQALAGASLLLLLTDHDLFCSEQFYDTVTALDPQPKLLDTRHAWDARRWQDVAIGYAQLGQA